MGRKKMTAEQKKVEVRLRVEPALHQRMLDEAKEEGNSIAAFIRTAVVNELKRRRDRRSPD